MKQKYEFAAVDTQGVEQLAFTLNVSQRQAHSVFSAMAFAMASDGGWQHLRVSLVLRNGERKQVNAATIKGAV